MLVHDNLLYIGGNFYSATRPPPVPPFEPTNIPVRSITSFNGSQFSALDQGLEGPTYGSGGPEVKTLAVYNGDLYVGGKFAFAYPYDCDSVLAGLARWGWDGTTYAWSGVEGGVHFDAECLCNGNPYQCEGDVYALQTYTSDPAIGPELYVGGYFDIAGTLAAKNIAKWHSSYGWSALNGGIGGDLSTDYPGVYSLAVFNDRRYGGPSLFVGGDFAYAYPSRPLHSVDTVKAHNIVRWDGTCWSALPGANATDSNANGTNWKIEALNSVGSSVLQTEASVLIVGGEFTVVGAAYPDLGGLDAVHIASLQIEDTDLDGVPDSCDNCPDTYNPPHESPFDCNGDSDETDRGESAWEQCDQDGDGVGDACDNCPCGHDRFDSDGDRAPNACDNCPDTPNQANTSEVDCNGNGILGETKYGEGIGQQCDSNADGIGDPCDQTRPTDLRLARIRDFADNTMETFEYDPADGKLTTRYRGTATQHILQSNYGYDTGGRLSIITHQPSDGTGPPRTVELKYDPLNPDQVVGTVHDDCGCGNGNRFVYRDSRGRVMRITTANDQPQFAPVLEEFEYMEASGGPGNCGADLGDANDDGIVDDRMTAHRRRNEAGVLVEVERRVYDGGPIGPYSVIVCRPSSGQFEVRKEHYDGAGRLEQLDEQDILQASCEDPGSWTASTIYNYYKSTNPEGETWTTYYPPAGGGVNAILS